MSSQMNERLQELTGLWVDLTSASMQRIPALCDEIAMLAARGEDTEEIDRDLLYKTELLSTTAEKRLTECLAIQTRTGSYSTRGALERSSRVATSGWEG
jgi:hypothetical protein